MWNCSTNLPSIDRRYATRNGRKDSVRSRLCIFIETMFAPLIIRIFQREQEQIAEAKTEALNKELEALLK